MMNLDFYFAVPTYTVVLFSCLLAILCGIVFKDILEYQFARWMSQGQPSKIDYNNPHLRAAYFLTCFFTTICVGASLSVFGVPTLFAYLLGAVVVVPTGILMWVQLGSMLSLAAREGLDAIDINVEMSDRLANIKAQSKR